MKFTTANLPTSQPIDKGNKTLFSNVMNKVPHTPLERNPLFPNVDPTKIGQPSTSHPSYPHAENQCDIPHSFHDNEYEYESKRHFVNTSTFYKLKWTNQCNSEADIFSFYESLIHMASTCEIPMNNLKDINEQTGVCPLTTHNCANFDKVYNLMKGAIFYKINDENLWTGYS